MGRKTARTPLDPERQGWVLDNMKLAYWRASKWSKLVAGKKMQKNDDFSEGLNDAAVLGLVIAASKYNDEYKGKVKFTSYAVHWVDRTIQDYLWSLHPLGRIAGQNKSTVIVGSILNEDGDIDNSREPADYRNAESSRDEKEEALNRILRLVVDPRTRDILRMRYVEGKTKLAVSKQFGISCERVRQLINKEMAALRRRIKEDKR